MKISNLHIMWNIIVQISFLEVLTRIFFLIRSNGKLETTVFPKDINYLAGTKLHSQFNIKNDTNAQYKHDVVSFSRWRSTNCTYSYKSGIAWYLSVRIVDQAGRDTNAWHTVRHCLNSRHETVNIENVKFLNLGYNGNT